MEETGMTRTAPLGLGRRDVLKAAAWSAPVIAVAATAPLAAASTVPPVAVCTVVPIGSYAVAGGTLSDNGSTGSVPTSNGYFGTGWTPAKEPTPDGQGGFVQTDGAVAPIPASWWSSGGQVSEPGFLSLDDHNNTDGASTDPVTVTLRFAAGVEAGREYVFSLPIFTSATWLGTQYLDVSILGAGVSQPGVVQGYAGNKSASQDIPELAGYGELAQSQAPIVTLNPTATDTVFFTYTFTLAYVHSGQRQNADMFVQAPQLAACV